MELLKGDQIEVVSGQLIGSKGKVFEIRQDGKIRFMTPDGSRTVDPSLVKLINRPEPIQCSRNCTDCRMSNPRAIYVDRAGAIRTLCQNGRPAREDVWVNSAVAAKCPNFLARTPGLEEWDQVIYNPLTPQDKGDRFTREYLPDFQESGELAEQARLLDMEEAVSRDPDAKLSKSWWLALGRPKDRGFKLHIGDTVLITSGDHAGQGGPVVGINDDQIKVQTPAGIQTINFGDLERIAKKFYGKAYKRPRASLDKYLNNKYGERDARKKAWRKRSA